MDPTKLSSGDVQIYVQVVSLCFQCVQTIVVVGSVYFFIRQISQQTAATKLQSESFGVSIYMDMMAEASQATAMLLTDEDLTEFFDQDKVPADLPDRWESLEKKFRKHYIYFARLLSLKERAFQLWSRHWMDPIDYNTHIIELFDLANLQFFSLWWDRIKPYYRRDFVQYVDNLVGKSMEDFVAAASIRPSTRH